MPELKDYPYETRLNVLCAALEVIDEKALGGWPSLKCGWPSELRLLGWGSSFRGHKGVT